MTWQFSKKSIERLASVHPDLALVICTALPRSKYDFTVTCGKRTKEEQIALVKSGASKTLNSRHLTGHAVDIAMIVNGKISWDIEYYNYAADLILTVAKELKIPVVWGGSWETFHDCPHFELSRKVYK